MKEGFLKRKKKSVYSVFYSPVRLIFYFWGVDFFKLVSKILFTILFQFYSRLVCVLLRFQFFKIKDILTELLFPFPGRGQSSDESVREIKEICAHFGE